MQTLKRYAYPLDIEEAATLLAAGRDEARAIAGGTSLVFHRGRGFHTLVDLSRLGLDHVSREDAALEIGAGVRLQQLADSIILRDPALRVLAEAARRAGPRAVRNAVTVGGNLVGYKRWADLPIPLCTLGASIHLAGPEGARREIGAPELMTSPPWKQLGPGELVTHIRVPLPAVQSGSAFVKFSRTFSDYALASAAARVTLDAEGCIDSASLFLGGLRHLPTNATALAQELVVGQSTLEEAIRETLATRLSETVEPAKDMRVSTAYLAELAGVLAGDALAQALTRAQAAVEDSDD